MLYLTIELAQRDAPHHPFSVTTRLQLKLN